MDINYLEKLIALVFLNNSLLNEKKFFISRIFISPGFFQIAL
jgi:hypothetical protein